MGSSVDRKALEGSLRTHDKSIPIVFSDQLVEAHEASGLNLQHTLAVSQNMPRLDIQETHPVVMLPDASTNDYWSANKVVRRSYQQHGPFRFPFDLLKYLAYVQTF